MTDLVSTRPVGLRGRNKPKAPEDRYALKWAHEYLADPDAPVIYPIVATEGLTDLGMQGNDEWSDCVEAGEVHLEMTTAVAAGTSFSPDPNLAVARAEQFAGFTSPPGPGSNMPDYLQALYTAGIILAWAPADHTNIESCHRLLSEGFGLLIGVSLYGSGDDQPNQVQFANHEPFDVVPDQVPNPEEGHCVLWGGQQAADGESVLGTWAAWEIATYAWMVACLHSNPNGEAYLVVTTEEQKAKFTPDLFTDVAALGGTGTEPPADVTPEPVPEPAPVPEPVPEPPAPVVDPPSFFHELEEDIDRDAEQIIDAVKEDAEKIIADIKEDIDPTMGRTPHVSMGDPASPPSSRF